MQKKFLEAGKIVNTFGVTGELKVQSWCDSAEVLLDFDTLYFSPTEPVQVTKAMVHKGMVIMRIAGINNCNDAERLKGKMLYLDRDDIELPEDLVFIQDIIGFTVFDQRTQEVIGTLKEVLPNPAHDMYIIRRQGKPEALIPACEPFLIGVDMIEKRITVETMEGLLDA